MLLNTYSDSHKLYNNRTNYSAQKKYIKNNYEKIKFRNLQKRLKKIKDNTTTSINEILKNDINENDNKENQKIDINDINENNDIIH